MKKINKYILIPILAIVLIFSVAAICNQREGSTPATTISASAAISDSISNETVSVQTTSDETITGNRNPEISDISIPQDILNTNHQYNISVIASDPDGDNLTYEWTVSGGFINNDVVNPMTWTTPDTSGNYTIQVIVKDGNDGESKKQRL